MENQFKRLTDFLVAHGIHQIEHTEKTYLAHLIAVYHSLQRQGHGDDVALAGMFHSIYGTELFQGFKLPLEDRAKVRELIGSRAEYLAYLNCAMDRNAFDRTVQAWQEPYKFRDRLTGQEVELSAADFTDLCRIHLFDWLEQVGRSGDWDYRRASYRQLAERLGSAAGAEYKRVFAGAPIS